MIESTEITIRKAILADVLKVLELYGHQIEYHLQFDSCWDLSWPNTAAATERIEKYVKEADRFLIVAEIESEVVGYLMGSLLQGHPASTAKKVAELDSMHVLESIRRRQVGRKLVDEFLSHCKQSGVDRIKLDVTSANGPAIAFYKSLGFGDYSSILTMDLR
jgi:ribosomal protein S18 acetylase RimI-like enzyme